MSTKLDLNPVPARASAGGHLGCPTAVATEVLLLRPHAVAADRGLWPMFVMVVTEPTDRSAPLALPLFELLDRPKHANELSIVAVESAWSVLDPANALLTVTVRAAVPITFDLRILLPAAPVLDILDVVARGATIGVTTRDRAVRLRGRVDVGTALRDVVLLSCPPSADLADLAGLLGSRTVRSRRGPRSSSARPDRVRTGHPTTMTSFRPMPPSCASTSVCGGVW